LIAQSNGEPPAQLFALTHEPSVQSAGTSPDRPSEEEQRMKRQQPRQALKKAKLDLTSPWLRCLLGSIIALQRPTPPSRRRSL